MKTLVIDGSVAPGGDVRALLSPLLRALPGEIRVLSQADGISPCCDCRRCRRQPGCAIPDGMREIYPYLLSCDSVILASPIWFASLSGPALSIASRLQTFYAAASFRREKIPFSAKKGVILLTGARADTASAPLAAASLILRTAGVSRADQYTVTSLDTDRVSAAEDARARDEIERAALFLQGRL